MVSEPVVTKIVVTVVRELLVLVAEALELLVLVAEALEATFSFKILK